VSAYEIIPLSSYGGSLTPLKYHDHNHECACRRREIGYNGMLIKCEGKDVVMIGDSVEFKPVNTEIQLSLF
jgi:hypothetical protein